jgi:hypothetical protein
MNWFITKIVVQERNANQGQEAETQNNGGVVLLEFIRGKWFCQAQDCQL